MNISIDKFLKSGILQGHAVLSGEKGLCREISMITVGEVPDLPKWLYGGELVMSTLYVFKNDKTLLKRFINNLIKAKASGLCLKSSRFLKKVDAEIIDISNKHNFPIINIPQNLRWTDIIQKFYETVLTEKIKKEVENQVKGDLLDEILRGDLKTNEDLVNKFSAHGCNIEQGCNVIIVSCRRDKIEKNKINRLHDYASYMIRSFKPNSFVSIKDDKLIVFLPPKGSSNKKIDIDKLAKDIYSTYKEGRPDIDIHIGISRFYSNPLDAVLAYKEALSAIDASTRIKGLTPIIFYEELGAYKLLLKLYETSPSELDIFFRETIEPILGYDKKYNSELIKTLEMYLLNEQNIAKTAGEMFLHRHSVRYRLQRIEDITGLDIYRSEDRERLSLGLKAYHLLRDPPL